MTENEKPEKVDPRTCWLAEMGGKYQTATREVLTLSKEDAEEQLEEWRDAYCTECNWFSVTRMRATVADT